MNISQRTLDQVLAVLRLAESLSVEATAAEIGSLGGRAFSAMVNLECEMRSAAEVTA